MNIQETTASCSPPRNNRTPNISTEGGRGEGGGPGGFGQSTMTQSPQPGTHESHPWTQGALKEAEQAPFF